MMILDTLLSQLHDVQHVATVRAAILDLAADLLRRRGPALDVWEATHLANAIGALSLNVHAVQQPTTAWLRLCLTDLEQALATPQDQHAPGRAAMDEQLAWDQLRDAVVTLAAEIGHPITLSSAPG